MEEQQTPLCLKGAKAICDAVNEDRKRITTLVEQHGLPAWRRNGSGGWMALPEDLRKWLCDQRDKHLGAPSRRGEANQDH